MARIKGHPSNNFKDEGYHRTTLRYSRSYYRYLEALAFRSQLDMAQLIRLLIHLAPSNEEFMKIVDQHTKPDRRVDIWIQTDFEPNMWKRC